MAGSTVLEVVIGLVFIYLIASLIASAINEAIENKLKNRSRFLEQGVTELLAGHPETIENFYKHPLISALYKGTYKQASANGDLPSYIPSRNFALALMYIVGGEGGTRNATASVKDAVAEVTALRAKAAAFPVKEISEAMVSLIDAAGNDVSRARQNLEDWFDSSMDRVSGWYKRRSQKFLLVIGCVLAAVGNIDTISVVNALATNPVKREALLAQARQAKDQTTPALNEEMLESADKVGLPVGWSGTWANERPYDPRSFPVDWIGWLVKVFGMLLTSAAISLGSPFWFDTLNRFVVVRSTVKPTEKSPPEKPKD